MSLVNPRSQRRNQFAVLLVSLFMSCGLLAQAEVDTFAVRPGRIAAESGKATPAELLANEDVGQKFCSALRCIVLANSPGRTAALRSLEAKGVVELEEIPDAHRVFFNQTTYDARSNSFSEDFRGREETSPSSVVGLFVVVFKSYPEDDWIRQIEGTGLVALESLQTMAYYFYGPREAALHLAEAFPSVYAVLDVPAGLKRDRIEWAAGPAEADSALAYVVTVADAKDVILPVLVAASTNPPMLQYRTGTTEAYSTNLSRSDALVLSVLPEVVSIRYAPAPPEPSDERSSRIISGTFQSPGTAWPYTPLPANSSTPRYWDGFLSQLSGIGIDLNNQVIGFLDTGIDSGLNRNGSSYCPPFLRPPTYPAAPCKLIFTADVTSDTPETIANDFYYHGSFTSALAAGYAAYASPGRDSAGYAFTQGVAQGARVGMCQFWRLCGASYRNEGEADPFTDGDYMKRLRYALVELGSTSALPDNSNGPGAVILNHSWNRLSIDYDNSSVLLDQTTRVQSVSSFRFRDNQTVSGPEAPILHVVSAGNRSGDQNLPENYLVTAPAVAKNVITVGSTESYNDQSYSPGCGNNDPWNADNPHQVADFTRVGFSNYRLKPDVVAPGVRSYGWRSIDWLSTCDRTNTCNMDLDGSLSYGWAAGTSFSAPVVAGAAAIVRDWFRVLGVATPAPALVKAALIAAATSITSLPACASGCVPCCSSCGDVRPSPDKYQGWGGASLDRLLRPATNYFYDNQSTIFTSTSQLYQRYLTIADNTKDINIALVWTDRASVETANPFVNLVNDLDLTATITSNSWYGNDYYYETAPDACDRKGYSLKNPNPISRDRKNNVERISIKASDIPVGATNILVQVSPFSLTGNGIDPNARAQFRQDFALFVENARQ